VLRITEVYNFNDSNSPGKWKEEQRRKTTKEVLEEELEAQVLAKARLDHLRLSYCVSICILRRHQSVNVY
jgi:hypothetical protein